MLFQSVDSLILRLFYCEIFSRVADVESINAVFPTKILIGALEKKVFVPVFS